MPDSRAKLFLRLYLPVTVLVLAGLALYGQSEVERERTSLRSREGLNVGLGAGMLSRNLEGVTRDLMFLADHSALKRALNEPSAENLGHLAEDFVNFSRSKQSYDQIRWLDETGQERVRVDYHPDGPRVVPAEQLQNKGKRYYVTDAVKLNPGEVFVSPLDLNIEQNRIEIPYKPMIRVGTPVLDGQGRPRGIVLLNYLGGGMLKNFEVAVSNIADHIMVVNGEGYWLRHPDPAQEWGFMFERPDRTLAAKFPAAWARIRNEDRGELEGPDGLWTWETVYPLLAGQHSSSGAAAPFAPSRSELESRQYVWKVVSRLQSEVTGAIRTAIWSRLALAGTVLLGLLGLGSWKLAQAWAAQAEAEAEVRRVNAGLERLVEERTRSLNEKVVELDVANEELARKNEEMESMIYIASHDLRSPLVNVQGFGQRIEKAAREIRERLGQEDVPAAVRAGLARLLEERIPTALGFIMSSSRKMDSLINGLLRLSRAGRVPIHPQPLEMGELVQEVLNSLEIQVQEANAEVRVELLPDCLGDAAQVNQIFTNLVDNALKYRAPDRPLRITIRGRRDEGRAIYEVEDNGIGVSPEHQAKVWQLFQRLDPAGPVEGEGIGLTLVRRILDRLHGQIRLESEPGKGSCFIVELPAHLPGEENRP